MSKFSQNIIDQIKKSNIKPKPKWQFLVLNALIWFGFGLAILIGGFDLSLIFRMLTAAPWDVIKRVGPSPIHSLLVILPYLWIIILIILFFASSYLIKHTKKGYRYTPMKIIGISLLGSFLMGLLFYFSHLDRPIERYLVHEFSPYSEWQISRGRNWVSPENGVITGFIIKVDPDKMTFELEDLKKEDWKVDFSEVDEKSINLITEDRSVNILGALVNDKKFKAKFIRPWSRGDLHSSFRKRLPKHRIKKMPNDFEKNFERR